MTPADLSLELPYLSITDNSPFSNTYLTTTMNKFFLTSLTAIACITASCTREVACETPPLNGFAFTSSTGQVSDTAAQVEPFIQGSHFKAASPGYQRNPLKGDANKKQFIADASVPGHDWRITLYPSGKQYHIEDIRVNVRKESVRQGVFGPAHEVNCLNTYHYTRDSTISVSTGDIQDGGLEIAY